MCSFAFSTAKQRGLKFLIDSRIISNEILATLFLISLSKSVRSENFFLAFDWQLDSKENNQLD